MKTIAASGSRGGRREAILDAATHLFSIRGYADTAIDDIGEAVGVTGPAVYRHFASKQELLVACFERAVERAAALVPWVQAEGLAPEEALRRMTDLTTRACVDDLAVVVLYRQESRNLPDQPRRHFAQLGHEFFSGYAETLCAVRPELTPSEARAAVHAAAALMRSVATRRSTLDNDQLHQLVASMAYAALMGVSTS